MSMNIAYYAHKQDMSFGFLGGFDKNFKFLCIAINQLLCDKPVKHPLIRRFTSFSKLIAYVEKAHDQELSTAVTFVRTYMGQVLSVLDILESQSVSFDKAQVKLLTIHKSKGLEFDKMYLASDIVLPTFDKSYSTCCLQGSYEEFNILYVALTRAKKELLLTPSFQEFTQNLEQASHKLHVKYT